MKKDSLILVILLLVSMVMISPVDAYVKRIYVDPASTILSQSPQGTTISPNADGTFKNWTKRTTVLRPNAGGTGGTQWTGRILPLNPNAEGTYSEWPAWIHLQPRADIEGNYTGWAGGPSAWDDWPNPDSDSSVVSTSAHNANETSALTHPPTERRSLTIQKVRVNIVAKKTLTTSDEQVQIMLATVLDANVTGREVPPSGWDGWARTGSSPWLDKEDWSSTGGNYIYTSTGGDRIGNFTFQDVPPGLTWSSPPHTVGGTGVQVRLKIWQTPLGNDTIKIYVYDGTSWKSFTAPTPWAVPDPSYVTYGERTDIDVSDFLNTIEKINNAKLAIEKVTSGPADTIYVDYACIRLSGVRKPASYGVTTGLTTSYATYYSDWSTNPVYNIPWNWTAIDALQAGVRSIQVSGTWSGALYVTQLYVGILTSQGLYKDWDEYPHPTGPNGGDEDFFSATADALRQSSALPDTPTPPFTTIAKVRVTFVARTNVTIPVGVTVQVQPILVIGGIAYPTTTAPTAHTPTTSYAEYSSEWLKNPATNKAWGTDWAAIDGLEAGVKSVKVGTWAGEIRVTQIYVKVIEAQSYLYWDDPLPDHNSDTDYVSAIAFEQSQYSGLENQPTGATWTPARVQVTIVARSDIETFDQVQIMLFIGGAPRFGELLLLSTSYQTYTSVWLKNPATSVDWDWTAINGMEAGVLSVDDGDGVWTGEIRVTQLYVVVGEDGTYTDWTTNDGDSTYFSATMGEMQESSALADTTQSWSIGRVRVVIVAKTNITTDEKVQPMLVIEGGTYPAKTAYTLTTTYSTYTADWGKNPRYNRAWEWLDIANLEAGVASVQNGIEWKGEIRVTQLYVEIAGPRFTVDIMVENVDYLYAYDMQLQYNTAVTSATAIIAGNFFTSYYVFREEVNDAAGYAWFGYTSRVGEKSGSGKLATIIFLVDSTGATTLDLVIKKLQRIGNIDITILGDVDGDRCVGTSDLFGESNAYGSKLGDSNWNSKADFNSDSKVDVFDLFDQSKNFGKSVDYDGYFSNS